MISCFFLVPALVPGLVSLLVSLLVCSFFAQERRLFHHDFLLFDVRPSFRAKQYYLIFRNGNVTSDF